MLGWKLITVPAVIVFGTISYLVYDNFIETGSSEEQLAAPRASVSATPLRTQSPVALPAVRSAGPADSPPATPPPPPPPPPDAVLVGAGDISSCTQDNDDRTASLLDVAISSAGGAAAVFTLGDNAYEYGTLDEFEQCYDPTWGRFKSITHPAPGNHEYASGNADGYFSYFGPAAGDPEQGYYSYDLGAWHVIVLNTSDHCHLILCDAGSPQVTWLRADLAAHGTVCTLAMWHDPLFSSGRVHGSAEYVQPFWDALYAAGVDLVVNGHEHNYERFAPQTPAGALDEEHGIREIIAGTGGESHYRTGPFLPNSETGDGNSFGVLKLNLRAASYDWEFLPDQYGDFHDSGSASCHGAPPGS